MRKRPSREDMEKKFVIHATADQMDGHNDEGEHNLNYYFLREKWPFSCEEINPSLCEGSHLRKPINLPLKEYEWNSLEKHTKTLGVQKTEWIRHAIFKLMYEEQNFLKSNIKD